VKCTERRLSATAKVSLQRPVRNLMPATEQFIDLAQRISGQDLSAFFQTWLYTTTRPTSW
jgi:hypothetical protein